MPREHLTPEREPSVGWLTWVTEYLDSQGINDEKYQSRMRTRLFNAITRQMWSDLLDAARREKVTIEDIGKRLHYHRGTVGRWITGESHPDSETVLAGMMFVLRRDFNAVNFTSQPDTVTRAVRDALVEIQKSDLAVGGENTLSLEGLRSVMIFHEQPDADAFLPNEANGREEQLRVAANVRDQVEDRFGVAPASAYVFNSIRTWAPAFALFMVGLPLGFKVRDEIAAAKIL